jgi:uncharacterized OB-fold protein
MNTTISAGCALEVSPLMRFRAHLERDELAYQYDAAGQRAVFYPRVIAPGSGSDSLEWRISAGVGEVHAVTVIRPKGAPAYNVALIDMAEGFRLMSRVEGVDADDVHIGMRVRFRTCRPDDGSAPHPVFDVEPTP